MRSSTLARDSRQADLAAAGRAAWRGLGLGAVFARRRGAEFWTGLSILSAMAVLCLAVPALSPFGVEEFASAPYQPPSGVHWFGTDSYGRDLFVRVFAGGRVDLLTAVVCVTVPLLCGTVIGVAAGMARRPWIDTLVMRIVDAVMAFPFVILILALVVLLGTTTGLGPLPPGLPSLFLAMFACGWAVYARLARIETRAVRSSDYILAARLLGYSRLRIAFRHVMPRVLRTTANYGVAEAVLIIVATSSLPFLGAGVQPPAPEWGNIMYEGRTVLATAWWVTVFPGAVCALTGIGISLLADSLISRSRGES